MFGNKKPKVKFRLIKRKDQSLASHTETRQTNIIPPEGATVVFDKYKNSRTESKVKKVEYFLPERNEGEIDIIITCIKQ